MVPPSRRQMLTASGGWRACRAPQVQRWARRPMPCPDRWPRRTSMLEVRGSDRAALPAKQSRSRHTRSAGQYAASAHAEDAKDIRHELSRIDMPNVSRCAEHDNHLWRNCRSASPRPSHWQQSLSHAHRPRCRYPDGAHPGTRPECAAHQRPRHQPDHRAAKRRS